MTRALRVLIPVVWACVAAMVVHLLLPLGRASVAGSRFGWDFWVKDVAETLDAVYALCLGVVAWLLYRHRVSASRALAVIGVVGAAWFGLFSLAIPLTGVLWTADQMQLLIPAVPLIGVLLTATWVLGTGIIMMRRSPATGATGRGTGTRRVPIGG